MEYLQLGQSDLRVSVLAFGAWQLGDTEFWGDFDYAEAERAVQYAIDAGINLFDTAEMYGAGESERRLGEALPKQQRDKIYIATKVSPQNCHPDKLVQSCEASLKRLQTDYIDIYQIHWPPRDIPFSDIYATMKKLQSDGKIRYIGVSNFGRQDLLNWLSATGNEKPVSNQIGYNLLFRAPEYEIIPTCRAHQIGIIVYMPLMQGLLAGRWKNFDDIPIYRRRTRHFSKNRPGTRHGEDGCERLTAEVLQSLTALSEHFEMPMARLSLAWLRWQRGVTSIIVGCRSVEQIKANIQAVLTPLDPDLLALLNEITYPLKRYMGTNADMWENQQNSRIH